MAVLSTHGRGRRDGRLGKNHLVVAWKRTDTDHTTLDNN